MPRSEPIDARWIARLASMRARTGADELAMLTSSQRSSIKRGIRTAGEISAAALSEASKKYQQMYGLRRETLQLLVDEFRTQTQSKVERQTEELAHVPSALPLTSTIDSGPTARALSVEQIAELCAAYRDAYVVPGDALTSVYSKYQTAYGVSRKTLKAAIKADQRKHPAAYLTLKDTRRQQEARKRNRHVRTYSVEERAPHRPPRDRAPLIADKSMLAEIAERLATRHATNAEARKVEELVRAFIEPPDDHYGYLAWRFSELSTRPSLLAEHSVDEVLKMLSTIVREDKIMIADLKKDYGRFLGDHSHQAKRALDAEFRKLQLGFTWTSGPNALRRSRTTLAFLRRAVVLTFASQDYRNHLSPLLTRLHPPPATEHNQQRLPTHVLASLDNLRRMVTQVDRLFSGIDSRPGHPYRTGLDQLRGLRSGAFDLFLESGPETVALPQASRLPLVILPPGERLQPFVAGIKRSGRFRGGEIDEGRLKVLTQLWTHLGESGTCSMYEGAFPASGNDNGYLILVIAYEGYGEDAVAISPCKGEHATFVVRADAGKARTWRTALTSTKDEAKELGARRLIFKANSDHGIDEYEAMFQKVVALFVCEPKEFAHGALYFDADEGRYEVRQV